MKQGVFIALIFLITLYILSYYCVSKAEKGKLPTVRTLPAVLAIDEAVGRAAEMGRPLSYTPGNGANLYSTKGPQMLASINIFGYVAEMCARRGVPIIFTTSKADSLPLVEETLRTAYMNAGKPEELKLDYTLRYQPGQDALVNSLLGSFQRERPASFMMLGPLAYETIVIGEGANTVGCFSIGGTVSTGQLPFVIATCDYTLLGEELYAASASLSKTKTTLGTLEGEDYFKYLTLSLLMLGIILEPLGFKVISWLLMR